MARGLANVRPAMSETGGRFRHFANALRAYGYDLGSRNHSHSIINEAHNSLFYLSILFDDKNFTVKYTVRLPNSPERHRTDDYESSQVYHL